MTTEFAIANSILIEAPDGAIVVDVTETMQAGAKSLAAFREVTKSPIKALIYTHNHADHVFGAKVKASFVVLVAAINVTSIDLSRIKLHGINLCHH